MVVERTDNNDAERIIGKIATSGRKAALPDESLELVKLSGIDVPDYALVKTAEEAVEMSKKIGFPLVLKVVSPDAIHKSDIGGVAVGINNVEEVERNYSNVIDNLKGNVPDARIAGVLIQRQMPEALHLIVGGVYDDQFGPVVMFGLGGLFVELFKDVSFRIVPVTEADAMEMVREIKAYPVLSGYRGSKMIDMTQLTETIVIISRLISNINEIKEIELNPLFVYEKSVKAVDARIILK